MSSQDSTGSDIRALYSLPVESCDLTLYMVQYGTDTACRVNTQLLVESDLYAPLPAEITPSGRIAQL